ncbi:MAG: SDR family NAD(P)-dependent oxidoreductase [bacterium]|nr:short-chain dehydrogenase/reductase [Deltaproteobacteria bacterium]MCP4903766.1 SDR family NAD(P)-dependent oxidoreductase [bacterium]
MSQAKTVLITGASSGLGASMAERMVGLGWRVFGTSRRPQRSGNGIEWIDMDVCEDASVATGLTALFERNETLDGLVCNAGSGIYGSVEETGLDRARAQFETNFFGVLRVLVPVLTHMRERNRGRILLIGSLSGRAPIPFQAHYSASKAAIEALAFSLSNEIHPFDIDISLIEPGDINTAFNDVMDWGHISADSPYAERSAICERSIRESLPKSPGPEIVADAVVHALTAKRPKLRYAVGREAGLVGIGKRLLSDRMSLKTIRDHFGI